MNQPPIRLSRCDLHIHTALSPCADSDMTPGNIIGMAMLIGLDILAITDHQSCGNCAAAMKISERLHGPLIIPGLEAESSEEIHLLCLFPSLTAARIIAQKIRVSQIEQPNRPEIFGEQVYYNEQDEAIGFETRLLLMPSRLSCDEIAEQVQEAGGVCLPAHVDRDANSLVTTLGGIPPTWPGDWLELSAQCDQILWFTEHPELKSRPWIRNSDAHYLGQIADPGFVLPVYGLRRDHSDHDRQIIIDYLRTRPE